ncbi:MAG: insulinase family protein [Caldilineaceae bacterium]
MSETHTVPVASLIYLSRAAATNCPVAPASATGWSTCSSRARTPFPAASSTRRWRAGGVFNGMTSHDWTTYFETFPSARIELALQAESDRMVNSLFDARETELERTVILSEREGSENSYFWLLNEEVTAAALGTRLSPSHHRLVGRPAHHAARRSLPPLPDLSTRPF